MNLYIGNTVEKAIKIPYKLYGQHIVEQKINEYIDQLFGKNDGDYFVMNVLTKKNIQGQEFKVVLVEDRDQIRHQVYFELVPVEQKPLI